VRAIAFARTIDSSGVERPRPAEDYDRRAVAERVEDRHRGMHDADVAVQRDQQRALRDLREAVRDGNRVLFVQAEQHPRVAGGFARSEVDDAVVQSAEAGTRHQRDVVEPEGTHERASPSRMAAACRSSAPFSPVPAATRAENFRLFPSSGKS
jgi:hypothetical protein